MRSALSFLLLLSCRNKSTSRSREIACISSTPCCYCADDQICSDLQLSSIVVVQSHEDKERSKAARLEPKWLIHESKLPRFSTLVKRSTKRFGYLQMAQQLHKHVAHQTARQPVPS